MKNRIEEESIRFKENALNEFCTEGENEVAKGSFKAGATWMQSELEKEISTYKKDLEESKQREAILNKVLSDKRKEIEHLQELIRWWDVKEELPDAYIIHENEEI